MELIQKLFCKYCETHTVLIILQYLPLNLEKLKGSQGIHIPEEYKPKCQGYHISEGTEIS